LARDLVCSVVLLVVAAGYYYLASGIASSALADEVGAAGLPTIYAFALGSIGLIMALQAVVKGLLNRVEVGEAVDLGLMLRRAGGVLGIGIGYLLIVSVVGYMIALVIVLAAMLIYFGERASGRIALAATVGAGLFWVLFDRLLGIPMPGIWGL
jgi:hypothetical protein